MNRRLTISQCQGKSYSARVSRLTSFQCTLGNGGGPSVPRTTFREDCGGPLVTLGTGPIGDRVLKDWSI